MSSKDQILQKIKNSQPNIVANLPDLNVLGSDQFEVLDTYKTVLKNIGGDFIEVANYNEIIDFLQQNYALERRIITTVPELSEVAVLDWKNEDPHLLQNVELTIIRSTH